MPWLTPDEPLPSTFTVTVHLPDEESLVSAFWGAFFELTRAENWEQYGTATPDDIAALFAECFELSN